MTDVVCLDAGVWIKALVAEDLSDEAGKLLADVTAHSQLVAPAFCWAEVGSVLRKRVRSQQITAEEATDAWTDFEAMTLTFLDTPAIRSRAWQLAESLGQSTLYDAAYLACTELADGASRAFWTADDALLSALGKHRPPYVRYLREVTTGASSS